MVAEEKYQGKVTWRTYLSYMQAAGGVVVVMFVIISAEWNNCLFY